MDDRMNTALHTVCTASACAVVTVDMMAHRLRINDSETENELAQRIAGSLPADIPEYSSTATARLVAYFAYLCDRIQSGMGMHRARRLATFSDV